MKYVLMFCADGDDVRRFATMTAAERAAQFEKVGAWFAENQARIIGGRAAGRAADRDDRPLRRPTAHRC